MKLKLGKSPISGLFCCLLALSLASCAHAKEASPVLPIALRFVGQLATGNFKELEQLESAALRAQLEPAKLWAIWQDLQGKLGRFSDCAQDARSGDGPPKTVILSCGFENATLPVQITVADGVVGGIFFGHPQPRSSAKQVFENSGHEIKFGATGWRLPGTLRLPAGRPPDAVAILVHGSGPLDRDSTIGETTLFKDLAEQLAQKGIATFRFEKRTRFYGLKFAGKKDFTIEEETVDDAVDAVRVVAKREEVAHKCMILLGHSLGGYLAPKIADASRETKIDGLVLLAAPGRNMATVLQDQFRFLLADDSVNEFAKSEMRVEIEKLDVFSKRSKSGDPQNPPGVFGKAAWKFFSAYDPIKEWMKTKIRTLALFGEKDYQVTHDDMQAWAVLARNERNLQVETLSGVGHVFTPVAGKPSPESYRVRAEMDGRVADTIATFARGACQPAQPLPGSQP